MKRKNLIAWVRQKGFAVLLFAALLATCCAPVLAAEPVDASYDFTEMRAGDALPDGFSGGTACKAGNGYLEIGKGGVLLLPETASTEEFTYEVKFTITQADEPSRWVGFLFHYQSAARYQQLCCRQQASGAGGLDCSLWDGQWKYPDAGKASFREDIDPAKIYTAKIVVKGKRVLCAMNGDPYLLTTTLLDGAGRFGVQTNGSTVRLYGVSISAAEDIPAYLPDGSENFSDLYEAQTGLVGAPTVLQKIETGDQLWALNTTQARPQIAWFRLADAALHVQLGNAVYTVDEVLSACSTAVLPLFETDDPQAAKALAAYEKERNHADLILASAQPQALLDAWGENPALRYAYLAGEIGEGNTAKEIAHAAHTAAAGVAILRPNAALTREAAEYLQLRGLQVWLDGSANSDIKQVYAAVDCGANGVTVKDFSVAYGLYEKVPVGQTTPIRRTFVVGHRGLPSRAPENSRESYLEAVKAGADAIECDVYRTRDGVLIANHDGRVDGYTTDPAASGPISSFTWDELSRFTLKPVGQYTNATFCKMEWYFQILKDNPTLVGYIELKEVDAEITRATVEMMESMGVADQVFFISFGADALRDVRQYAPYAGTGYLATGTYANSRPVNSNLLTLMKAVGATASTADYAYTDLTAELLRVGRHRGVTFQCWTVNDRDEAVRYLEQGVHAITTNYADFSQDARFTAYRANTATALFGPLPAEPGQPGTTQPEPSDAVDPPMGEGNRLLFAGLAALLSLLAVGAVLLLRRVFR